MGLKHLIIVAENASMQMGGEACLPLYYFRLFRKRGLDVHLVCHARVRPELTQLLTPEEFAAIHFVEDTKLQVLIHRLSNWFPLRIQSLLFGELVHLLTQIRVRSLTKALIRHMGAQIILEPAPVMPKGISLMYGMGVPVVIGPMSGGMNFPPAFRYMDSPFTHLAVWLGRSLSNWIHRLFPGKLQADALIVANPQTAAVLPRGYQGQVYELIEIAVELPQWKAKVYEQPDPDAPVRFVFSGRFVDWKGIQFLVQAFHKIASRCNAVLDLVGDGELRSEIESSVAAFGLQERVRFHGWLPQAETAAVLRDSDVFVLPSLRECGGMALMEAMATGLPGIATNWAGPTTFMDNSCGILIDPSSPTAFVEGLADAMLRLAQDPALRQRLGKAARQRVETHYYNWELKVDRVLEILEETLEHSQTSTVAVTPPQLMEVT
ncbi:MAG TPA: glycosyltransferase family 4 protein [Allocoleopsis sp.]